ncbi:MAG TPA: amidohydrolase family protein [Actinomycetota bacterium]|nr:amidohydrolase family protein [Actinomycetota bacterium]
MLDLVISGALVMDGSGAPGVVGSVGVAGDRIAVVAREGEEVPEAARMIGGSGLVLAPGWIDVHNHSDLSPLLLPTMPSTVRQGVTTVVVGNCGSSPYPLAGLEDAIWLANGGVDEVPRPSWTSYGDYLETTELAEPAVNIATLVGHGSLRRQVLGLDRRPPTAAELAGMRALASEAMEAGAFGLSTGLIYVPGSFAATDEIVEIAGAAADAGGLYASHIRGEARTLFAAVEEALAVGERAELPAHISHLKCDGAHVAGRSAELLATLHDAADATADQYPYTAWNSQLASLLPAWAPVADVAHLGRTDRPRLAAALDEEADGVGWDRIVVIQTAEGRFNGQDVSAIAGTLGVEPVDAVVRLLDADPTTSIVGHAMREDDVERIFSDPEVFVASDASATAPDGPGGDHPVHPRDYGTFPRALALARDRGLLPIETVVRKMTSLPAERFGIRDRGTIREGAFADLVLFDPAAVRDTSTYEASHAFPVGIGLVVVNGRIAWESNRSDEIQRSGRVLRR